MLTILFPLEILIKHIALGDSNSCVTLQAINLVLTILFTLEMLIKHVALGLLGYWSNGFNVLDGLIVVASLVDLGLEYSGRSPLVLLQIPYFLMPYSCTVGQQYLYGITSLCLHFLGTACKICVGSPLQCGPVVQPLPRRSSPLRPQILGNQTCHLSTFWCR